MATRKRAKKNEPTARAASRVVGGSLSLLWRLLGKAAKVRGAGSVDAVHDLRVASRRAAVTLRVFKELLEDVQLNRMRAMVRQIRKAADKARDLDVLTESFKRGAAGLDGDATRTPAILARLHRERLEAQQPIEELLHGLTEAKFPGLTARLAAAFEKSARGGAAKPFRQFARNCLKRPRRKFFAAAEADLSKDSALHQLRICAKKLRYSLELTEPAFGSKEMKHLVAEVTLVQDMSGQIHDHFMAIDLYSHWRAATQDPGERVFFEGLLQGEARAHEDLYATFESYFTKAYLKRLRKSFGWLK